MAGSYLGTGATHVVCHPQTAVKWLAMGELCKSLVSFSPLICANELPNFSLSQVLGLQWLQSKHGKPHTV